MDEMAVDIDEAGAILLLMDQMVIPDFVVKGTRAGHCGILQLFANRLY